jgi:hypothetical protein
MASYQAKRLMGFTNSFGIEPSLHQGLYEYKSLSTFSEVAIGIVATSKNSINYTLYFINKNIKYTLYFIRPIPDNNNNCQLLSGQSSKARHYKS